MKKILIFTILIGVLLLADGGSIVNHQKTIEQLSQKQEHIKRHLQKLDNFLAKYDTFASSYLTQLRSIVKEGAKCEILKERYLYALEKKGKYDTFTEIKKGRFDDCYQMKANRMKAIKNVKQQVSSLKNKVDDILELRDIDINEADTIKEYIDDLRRDISLYKNSNNF